MNHLEALVAEWLTYRGYFVRTSVRVGLREEEGGYAGELDVVAVNPSTKHFVHVECSLDAISWEQRRVKYERKFARGREFSRTVLKGLALPDSLDQVLLLVFAGGAKKSIGEARVILLPEFLAEMKEGLAGKKLTSGMVPETLPLLRTVHFVMAGQRTVSNGARLVRDLVS
jgi:hypothetical protein